MKHYANRRTRRRALPFAFLLISTAVAVLVAMPAAAATLTINQATDLALKNNKQYLVAQAQYEKADAEVKNAVAGALPHLDMNTRYTRNFEIPEIVFGGETFRLGTTHNVDIGFSLTQPIWLGGKVFTALKIAKLYRSYSSEMLKEAEGDVVLGVRQAFLGAILAKDVVGVYRDAVATAQFNLDMVQQMRNQGVVSNYEELRAEVELANLKPQLIQAENQVTIAEQQLKNLIGMQLTDQVDLVYDFDSTSIGHDLNLDYIYSVASEHRPVLKESEYFEEINRKAIGIAKAGHRPQISVSSALDWTLQADEFDVSAPNWSRSLSATFNVAMPIFDGFATSAEVKKAKLDYRSSTLQRQDTENQVELEVREAYLTYNETGDRLQAQAKTIEQAQEGLRIARLRYEQGVGTQLEVLSAESALTQARTNYVQATHDAAVAVYRLLKVTGVENLAELREQ